MIKAYLKDTEIASSQATIVIEGNHYFPVNDVHMHYFSEASLHTTCPWKGVASYYDITVDGHKSKEAAWTYKDPKNAAAEIKGYLAFWKDVLIKEES